MKKFFLAFSLMLAMALPAFAIDSTQLFDTKVLGTNIQQGSSGGIPVGTVIAWPVSSNPDDVENWLECNGQAISRSVYPELFAVVGGSVPDYRGLFLRGVGGNSASLGIGQGDAIRNITGSLERPTNSASFGIGHYSGAFSPTPGHWESETGVLGSSGSGWKSMDFDASHVVPTAEENRPVNKAVRYLIRSKP